MPQHRNPELARLSLLLSRALAVATLAALVALFGSAGALVQDGAGLTIHGSAAVILHCFAGLLALALALRAWVTGHDLWVALIAVFAFVLTFVQAQLGGSATLAFHITGALVIAVLFTALTVWSFRPDRSTAGLAGP